MSLLHTLVAFIVALAILILFHELGHYWAARLCNVKVLRFSIGFGRPLVLRRSRGPDRTEWVVAALPFGGFVRMLDEREGMVAPGEAHRAFNRQSVWKRIFIVAAGPVANFLLAIAVYAGMYMYGVTEARPVLAAPPAGTAAAAAGIRARDEVRTVNGVAVTTFQQLRWQLLDIAVAKGVARLEVVDEADRAVSRTVDMSRSDIDDLEGDPLTKLGLRLYRPPAPAVIGVLEAGGAARAAGVREGDRIVAVDGEPITGFDQVVTRVVANPGKALTFDIERDGAREAVVVTPRAVERDGRVIGRIGAGPRIDPAIMKPYLLEERFGPVQALARGTVKTWDMSVFSLRMLGKMVKGEISLRNISGPITIADYAGQAASLGLLPYLTLIALVSISLGVLNLLPIPVLDGGHLLYYFAEVLKGRPLSDRTMEMGQRIGMALLLCLMVFAIYNDINRLLSG